MAQRKYLDLTGLTEFKAKLVAAYAENTASSYPVNYAATAGEWATARTVTFAGGDVTGSFSIKGNADVSNVALSVADVVASTSGAGGSHGLMTAAQAEKLGGIAAGAEANVLEGVQLKNNGDADYSDLTITNKKVQIDLSDYALKSDITSVLDFKGTKADQASLPSSGNKTGDVWAVSADNSEYVWTGSAWEKLGPTIDLTGYVEKTQKVNNKALSGDITLDGSDIALSTNYAAASTAAAPAAGDSIDTAVGKLQKEIADANAAATTYAFAEGSTNGAFQVTPTVGGVAGQAQSVSIHGLGSAAYAETTDFVSSTLTPAEAGAQVNKIESITINGGSALPITNKNVDITIPSAEVTDVQVKGNGDNAYASVLDGTVAKIDLSAYALDADIIAITTAEVDSLFPTT